MSPYRDCQHYRRLVQFSLSGELELWICKDCGRKQVKQLPFVFGRLIHLALTFVFFFAMACLWFSFRGAR